MARACQRRRRRDRGTYRSVSASLALSATYDAANTRRNQIMTRRREMTCFLTDAANTPYAQNTMLSLIHISEPTRPY